MSSEIPTTEEPQAQEKNDGWTPEKQRQSLLEALDNEKKHETDCMIELTEASNQLQEKLESLRQARKIIARREEQIANLDYNTATQ